MGRSHALQRPRIQIQFKPRATALVAEGLDTAAGVFDILAAVHHVYGIADVYCAGEEAGGGDV